MTTEQASLSLFDAILDSLKERAKEDEYRVLKFWQRFLRFYGFYRVERTYTLIPPKWLADMVVAMSESEIERLFDRLAMRLKSGQEWPPSFQLLEILAKEE